MQHRPGVRQPYRNSDGTDGNGVFTGIELQLFMQGAEKQCGNTGGAVIATTDIGFGGLGNTWYTFCLVGQGFEASCGTRALVPPEA